MQKEDKLRVTIDTNLIVSGIIITDSIPDKLIQAWHKNQYTLLMSDDILEELQEVLQRDSIKRKYHLSSDNINQLLTIVNAKQNVMVSLTNHDRFRLLWQCHPSSSSG